MADTASRSAEAILPLRRAWLSHSADVKIGDERRKAMATLEQLEQRVRSLEIWANREALKRGTLGFIVERMIAEQLAAMPLDQSEQILTDLTNPYRFQMRTSGSQADDERFKRQVGEAATRQVEEVVESIRKRAGELRAAKPSSSDEAASG